MYHDAGIPGLVQYAKKVTPDWLLAYRIFAKVTILGAKIVRIHV